MIRRSASLLIEHLAALLIVAITVGLLARTNAEYQRIVITERRATLARYAVHTALDLDIAPNQAMTLTLAGESYVVEMKTDFVEVSYDGKIIYRFSPDSVQLD